MVQEVTVAMSAGFDDHPVGSLGVFTRSLTREQQTFPVLRYCLPFHLALRPPAKSALTTSPTTGARSISAVPPVQRLASETFEHTSQLKLVAAAQQLTRDCSLVN